MKKSLSRKLFSIFTLFSLLFQYAGPVVGLMEMSTYAKTEEEHKIDICHAASSETNPYTVNNVDMNSTVGGHDDHDGPLWYPGIKDDLGPNSWGDIIPPFPYGDGESYLGKNWTAEGQAIWNNGCVIPSSSITVVKETIPDGDSTTFRFIGDLGSFNLYGDGDSAYYGDLDKGLYNVHELLSTEWELTKVNCVGDLDNGSYPDADGYFTGYNVDLDIGENIVCTFTNTREVVRPGSIRIFKDVVAADGSQVDDSTVFGVSIKGKEKDVSEGSMAQYSGLESGVYTIFETDIPDGYEMVSIRPDLNSNKPGAQVRVVDGQVTRVRVVNRQLPSTIKAIKFEDIDGDGTFDSGEQMIEGWRMYLFEGTGCNGKPVDSKLTNVNGVAKFKNLSMGSYSVAEETKDGWINTNGICKNIKLDKDEVKTRVFGNFKLGMIQGRKYEDLDYSGTHEVETEERLNGWIIRLYDSEWNKVDEKVTGHTGNIGQYRFNGLIAGTYYVTEVIQDGWNQSGLELDIPGATAVDNMSANSLGEGFRAWQITIDSSGQEVMGRKFGNVEVAVVKGYKFEDLNNNGQRDEGEPGLNGWSICLAEGRTTLFSLDNYVKALVNSLEDDCVVTGSEEGWEDGYYEFTLDGPAIYRVYEKNKEGWTQTFPETDFYFIDVMNLNDSYDFGNRMVLTDVSIEKTDNEVDLFNPGDEFEYTLGVSNNSLYDTAVNVVVTDVLPAEVSFVSIVTTRGNCTENLGTITCNLGDLLVGEAAEITITVLIDEDFVGEIENVATVESDTYDDDPTNNEDDEQTLVEEIPEEEGEVLGEDTGPEVLAVTGQSIQTIMYMAILAMLVVTYSYLELDKKE